jgi:hypothetical protein
MKDDVPPDPRESNITWFKPVLVFTSVALLLFVAVRGYFWSRTVAITRAHLSEAQVIARTLTNAVLEYQSHFGSLPAAASTEPGRDADTDSSAAEGLMATLLGIDDTSNSRKINFLGDIKKAVKSQFGKYAHGLIQEDGTAELVDPWGDVYRIRIDIDGDGFINDPSTPGNRLKARVIVWSAGKDRDSSTWDDNIASWQTAP